MEEEKKEEENCVEGEIRCIGCGTLHANPSVIDIYNICGYCGSVLRWPKELRETLKPMNMLDGLRVLSACYGHPSDPTQTIDVTSILQRRIDNWRSRYDIPLNIDSSYICVIVEIGW